MLIRHAAKVRGEACSESFLNAVVMAELAAVKPVGSELNSCAWNLCVFRSSMRPHVHGSGTLHCLLAIDGRN